MSNLFNSNPVPSGLRLCFWHPEYIAAQPFCITSKLTQKEKKELAEFEEMKFWERAQDLQQHLELIDDEPDFEDTRVSAFKIGSSIDIKKVIKNYMDSPKKFYFFRSRFVLEKAVFKFGFCNTQTNDGLPSKSSVNRSHFLAR